MFIGIFRDEIKIGNPLMEESYYAAFYTNYSFQSDRFSLSFDSTIRLYTYPMILFILPMIIGYSV